MILNYSPTAEPPTAYVWCPLCHRQLAFWGYGTFTHWCSSEAGKR